jgi:ATP-dependent Lon protease
MPKLSTKFSGNSIYPVLPLRDIVVFPHMIVPLFVGREKSVQALDDVMREDKQILLVTQKNAGQDDPTQDDLYRVGTIGTVLQLLKLPDGTVKVLVEGSHRARIENFTDNPVFFQAVAEPIEDALGQGQELEALSRAVVAQFEQYIKLNKKIAPEVLVSINQIDDPAKLADTVAAHLNLKIPEKQQLLELATISERLERVYGLMESEIGVLQVEKRIRNRVKRQMEKTQREYYLNEQLKAIQKELGETEEGKDEMAELEDRINKTRLTKEAKEKAKGELKKLRTMSPCPPRPRSCATISIGCCRSRGASAPRSKRTSSWRRACLTPIITALKRSRNAFSNILLCSNARTR